MSMFHGHTLQAASEISTQCRPGDPTRTALRRVFVQIACLSLLGILSSGPARAASLYLPRVESDQIFETGLAFSNTESAAGTATVFAYDSTG